MTGVNIEYVFDDKLRLLLENYMRCGPSFCMSNRHVKLTTEKKLLYENLNNLYDWSMSQNLPTGDCPEIELT